MEPTVQIGLVFPRSGQQVFVYVPARYAESVQKQYAERVTQNANISANSYNSRSSNDSEAHL